MTKPKGKKATKSENKDSIKESHKAYFRMGITLSNYGRLSAGAPVTDEDRAAFKAGNLDIEHFIK